jgi:hypothetical protein
MPPIAGSRPRSDISRALARVAGLEGSGGAIRDLQLHENRRHMVEK